MTATEVAHLILDMRVRDSESVVLGNLNLHALYLYTRDHEFRAFCDAADLVLIDGWPILILSRLGGARVTRDHRIGSTDWLQVLLQQSATSPLKVVAIGGTAESAARAKRQVEETYQSVTWDAFDGYTDWSRRQAGEITYATLESSLRKADLVLVGMGMPTQERWIMNHLHLTRGAVIANVGGCIDYLAGAQTLAPRWLGPLGLEWAFRLARDPRRLWHRYLVEPAILLAVIVMKAAARAADRLRRRII